MGETTSDVRTNKPMMRGSGLLQEKSAPAAGRRSGAEAHCVLALCLGLKIGQAFHDHREWMTSTFLSYNQKFDGQVTGQWQAGGGALSNQHEGVGSFPHILPSISNSQKCSVEAIHFSYFCRKNKRFLSLLWYISFGILSFSFLT